MKVQIDNRVFIVKWQHQRDSRRAKTVCFIRSGDDLIAESKATCDTRDRFCKQTGRKRSMASAIGAFDRRERSEFWKQYDKEIGLTK
jgi:hypothetical protein